jgi:hypothetical protein
MTDGGRDDEGGTELRWAKYTGMESRCYLVGKKGFSEKEGGTSGATSPCALADEAVFPEIFDSSSKILFSDYQIINCS